MAARQQALLEIQRLDVYLGRHRLSGHAGTKILDGVDLSINSGEIVGLIGETGSGKTTLARTIVGLYQSTAGEVSFDGRAIARLGGRARRAFRRSGQIQLVFQSPLRSLDPDMTVGDVVGEGLAIQGELGREEIRARAAAALAKVGLDAALLARRPGTISGGQRQRVAIARAIVMNPKLLIFDEPVSALDASSRNYILKLLMDLRQDLGVAMIVISHDLTSIAGIADRVLVLYLGSLVEDGPIPSAFSTPRHPYTGLLIASAPSAVRAHGGFEIPAAELRKVADPEIVSDGCPFAPRCLFATNVCWEENPAPETCGPDWTVRCHHFDTWRETMLASRAVASEQAPAAEAEAVVLPPPDPSRSI